MSVHCTGTQFVIGGFPLRGVINGRSFELLFWLTFAALGFYFSLDFDRKIEFYRFGAATWPRVVLGLIVLAALGQWWTARRQSHDDSESSLAATTAEHGYGYLIRLAITFGLPLLYAASWQNIGFYFATPIFLVAYLYVTGERRLKWLILVPLGIYLVLMVIFTRYLYLGLPVGYWHPFYDFSNWLIPIIRG